MLYNWDFTVQYLLKVIFFYLTSMCSDFPVTSFDGEKRVILSTTSWIGGKNPFLGIAYITVGVLCLVLGLSFLIIHLKFGKR